MVGIAVVNFISRQKTQTRQGLKALLDYCSRNAKTTYNGRRLVTGINCVAQSTYNEMMNTKLRYKKADGRMYYHLLQSFHPDEQITPETAHKIALRFAEENFLGYEVLVLDLIIILFTLFITFLFIISCNTRYCYHFYHYLLLFTF